MNPDKRNRVLIIGVGSIGERHTRCFLHTRRAEVAIVEPNDSLRGTVADRYSIAQAWRSLEDIRDEHFDAAVIATPAPSHVPIAIRLTGTGMHLMIEKPLALRQEDADALVSATAGSDRIIAVAYVYRAHPALAEMREAIVSGRFGKPVQLVATCGQHFPTYRPAYRHTYYTDQAAGGGAVQDALTHIIDAGQWLVGPIDRLVADVAHQVLADVQVEDTVHVLARHGNVLGSYSLNQHQAPNEVTITVICERGTARFESHERRWRWMTEPGGQWHDHPKPEVQERDALFIRQAHAFLDAIENNAPPLCSLADGVRALEAKPGDPPKCRRAALVRHEGNTMNAMAMSGLRGKADVVSGGAGSFGKMEPQAVRFRGAELDTMALPLDQSSEASINSLLDGGYTAK